MNRAALTLVVAIGLLPDAPLGPIPDSSRQLIVVVTPAWESTAGVLRRFERTSATRRWRQVGADVEVVVGRAGLGWGRGLHGDAGSGPRKREGDGRAPAGVFHLSDAFGYAPSDSVDTGLRYLQSTPDLECVDDVGSSHYNKIVDRRAVAPDWDSHEEMRRPDVLYRRGVVVDHNVRPAVPRAGSCIFLHVWRGPGSTTSGCTAMEEPSLVEAMAWLDAAANPVVVQLTTREYSRRRAGWELPDLP